MGVNSTLGRWKKQRNIADLLFLHGSTLAAIGEDLVAMSDIQHSSRPTCPMLHAIAS